MEHTNPKYSRVLNPLNGKEIIVKSFGKVNGTLPSTMSKYRKPIQANLTIRGRISRGEIEKPKEQREKNFDPSPQSKESHIAFLVFRRGLTVEAAERAYQRLKERVKAEEENSIEKLQPKLNDLMNKYNK